jgi:ribosome-associated toxin RatA of RatAB toxin-antitoxin module|tara:strand:+ start:20 stop:997 length:978 start_codon:yes stop_codon:yes gene_type:complete
MKKSDKKILVFYVCLGISLLAAFSYFDSLYERPHIDLQLKTEPIKNKNFENIINTVPPTSMYEVITDVENYPIVLPKNILSVKILDRTNNSITAEEQISEHGIKSTLTVKHSFVPMEKHTIEVLDGDAKGTIITQNFEIIQPEGSLKITTNVELDLKGIFSFIGFLPISSIQHAVDTTIDEFAIFAAKKLDLSEKEFAIELLYREVLLREADPKGVKFYVQMLEEGMTIDDVKKLLMESDEYQNRFVEVGISSMDELNPETIKTIDDLYLEILDRSADNNGILYYGSLLETGVFTTDDIRQSLMDSAEYDICLKYNPYSEFPCHV